MISEDSMKGKVTVKKFRRNGWLPAGHDGEFTYTHCFQELATQVDGRGRYVTGLTEEEERFLETKMALEKGTLSSYNKDFWSKFRIKIGKTGRELDLSVPSEFLEFKVLTAHDEVANSEVEKAESPLAEYVLTSLEQEAKEESKIFKKRRKAYKAFGEMSYEDMAAYLKVAGKRVSEDTSGEVLEAAIGKEIDMSPDNFLAVVNDPAFKLKVFIDDCLAAGALVKNGSKYTLRGGDIIGYDIDETISYLGKAENQEVYISLKHKLEVK